MTDGESARLRRNDASTGSCGLMTDGAIRCGLVLAQGSSPQVPFAPLRLRSAPTGWPPRCRFKVILRVVAPTRMPEWLGVVGWLTRLEQSIKLPSTLTSQSKRKGSPPAASTPRLGGFRFWPPVTALAALWGLYLPSLDLPDPGIRHFPCLDPLLHRCPGNPKSLGNSVLGAVFLDELLRFHNL